MTSKANPLSMRADPKGSGLLFERGEREICLSAESVFALIDELEAGASPDQLSLAAKLREHMAEARRG